MNRRDFLKTVGLGFAALLLPKLPKQELGWKMTYSTAILNQQWLEELGHKADEVLDAVKHVPSRDDYKDIVRSL